MEKVIRVYVGYTICSMFGFGNEYNEYYEYNACYGYNECARIEIYSFTM